METNEERKWCVYIHTNKINNKVYIGQTCDKPTKRWKNGKGYINNKHFWNAICKYGWENFNHIIFAENLTKEAACKMEKLLIALYNATDKNKGYNNAPGGETCAGVVRSEETRRKLSQNAKIRFSNPENCTMFGKKHTKEAKEKMSIAQKERYKCPEDNPMYGRTWWDENTPQEKIEEWKRHKSEATSGYNNPNYGNHWSQEIKDQIMYSNPNTKTVLQFNLNGCLLREYASIRQAVRETGLKRQSISHCCNYKETSCGGFFWMFKSEYEKYGQLIYKQDDRFSEEVIQCDDFGNIVATYNGPTEAHRVTGIGLHAISKCLNKKSKHSGGYRWFYPKDYEEFMTQQND